MDVGGNDGPSVRDNNLLSKHEDAEMTFMHKKVIMFMKCSQPCHDPAIWKVL
jgi:hypothetical protein